MPIRMHGLLLRCCIDVQRMVQILEFREWGYADAQGGPRLPEWRTSMASGFEERKESLAKQMFSGARFGTWVASVETLWEDCEHARQ